MPPTTLAGPFFAASNATKQEYGKEHYVGVLDKTTGITVERYNNNDGKRDSSGNVSYTKTNADWKHVDIVISGATAKLYIDSKLVAVNNNGQKLADTQNNGLVLIHHFQAILSGI